MRVTSIDIFDSACRVIQGHAVKVSQAHDDLKWVAEAAPSYNADHSGPGQRSPSSLEHLSHDEASGEIMYPTTVIASTLRTKGSDVKYRESDKAYSFHNCAKRS